MSQLVVFDLEWNMGYKPRLFRYQGVEQTLRGEIIQIGAVKMEGQKILDTFRVILRPCIFRKLHHQIARVTGLTQGDIDGGVPFAEGLRQFQDWCGEQAVLGEWGLDDIPVLKQNLVLAGMNESWPEKWYDLQKVFTSQRPLKEGESLSLENMVDHLEIEKNEDFHDALADALYTAKVMQHIDIAKGLAAYPDDETQLRRLLFPADRQRYDFISWKGFADGETWRKSPKIRTAVCPDCGKPLIPDAEDMWLNRGNNCMYSLRSCSQHGPVMIWLRRSCTDGLHYRYARATEKMDGSAEVKWAKEKKYAKERARRRLEEKSSGTPSERRRH